MTSMNTLVCQEPKILRWEKRQIPIPGDDEVLIKIKTVGICGTDIHAWGGHQPFFSYPRVLGHEICGEIIGLGKNILNLKSGQQVAVIPYVACGQCPACLSGRTNCCEKISVIGVHRDGGFSEYLCVPVKNLLVVDDVEPEAAALIEPFAISAHAVRRAAIQPGEQVLVVGAGPIGLGGGDRQSRRGAGGGGGYQPGAARPRGAAPWSGHARPFRPAVHRTAVCRVWWFAGAEGDRRHGESAGDEQYGEFNPPRRQHHLCWPV